MLQEIDDYELDYEVAHCAAGGSLVFLSFFIEIIL